jgi:hypothetical protein
MYEYPLAVEAKIEITVPASSNLELRAWELRLIRDPPIAGDAPRYDVPADLGPGYVGIIWEGTPSLELREDLGAVTAIEGGLGVFFLDQIAAVGLAEGSSETRVAVIGVLDAAANNPDLGLPGRGKCNIDSQPMPDVPDGTQRMILILRQLQFTEKRGAPGFPKLEDWSRPGYFLTTIDGPQAGDPCDSAEAEESELDLIALPAGVKIPYRPGSPGFPLAFIIDFYAKGDPAKSRNSDDGGPTPGCYIRCWGS